MSLLKKVLILGNLALVCFTIMAFLSPHISPDKYYIFSFFGLAYPWLFLFHVLFILAWLAISKRYILISLITIIMSWSATSSFISFNGDRASDQKFISVMSYNAENVKKVRKKSGYLYEDKRQSYIDYMNSIDPVDLLCTQETSHAGVQIFEKGMYFKHSYIRQDWGTSIFSMHPIVNKGEIALGGEVNACIWADIKLADDTIRVYNIHLRSNQISMTTEKVLEDADLQTKKTWLGVRKILSNYKNSTIVRVRQSKLIKEHIDKSPHKTIVCGDFNDTPLSYAYNTLSNGMKDSFNKAGNGIGFTYAGLIPTLRIDYILSDDRLDIIEHKVYKGEYSDHYPISARIVLQ